MTSSTGKRSYRACQRCRSRKTRCDLWVVLPCSSWTRADMNQGQHWRTKGTPLLFLLSFWKQMCPSFFPSWQSLPPIPRTQSRIQDAPRSSPQRWVSDSVHLASSTTIYRIGLRLSWCTHRRFRWRIMCRAQKSGWCFTNSRTIWGDAPG